MTPKELNAIAAKLAEQVKLVRRKQAEVVPPGWATARQIAKAGNRDLGTVLEDLKAVGAERRNFMVACSRAVLSIPHYRLK